MHAEVIIMMSLIDNSLQFQYGKIRVIKMYLTSQIYEISINVCNTF